MALLGIGEEEPGTTEEGPISLEEFLSGNKEEDQQT
jgi:hypothetical protein